MAYRPLYAHARLVSSGHFVLAYVDYSLLNRLHLTWTRVGASAGLHLSWGALPDRHAPAALPLLMTDLISIAVAPVIMSWLDSLRARIASLKN